MQEILRGQILRSGKDKAVTATKKIERQEKKKKDE